MKIICKYNNLNEITNPDIIARLKRYIFMPNGEIDLQAGREYSVYGVEFRDNCPWFYICTEDYDDYPKAFDANFFEITNNGFPPNWQLGFDNEKSDDAHSLITFPEWAKDVSFYERLVDGDSDAVSTFAKYRAIINNAQLIINTPIRTNFANR